MKVCFNGQVIEEEKALISPFGEGVQFGVGVFETFRVVNKVPVFFEDHLERLERSRIELDFTWPKSHDLETLTIAVKKFLNSKSFEAGQWRARITLTPDFWSCKLVSLDILDEGKYKFGVEVDSVVENRIFTEAKGLSPLYPFYGRREFFETLFFDENDFLKEGNLTNVFIITEQNVVVTPKNGVLKGIMRQKVIEYLRENNQKIECRDIDKSELLKSRSLFLTNVIKGIVPVARFGDWRSDNFDLAHELQAEIFNRIS